MSVGRRVDEIGGVAVGKTPLLEIAGLSILFAGPRLFRWALRDVSFRVEEGEVLGVIGPSGAGKTTLARAVLGLETGHPGVVSGKISVLGTDLCRTVGGSARIEKTPSGWVVRASLRRLSRSIRDERRLSPLAMAGLFQHPLDALHPLRRLGDQVVRAAARAGTSRAATAHEWLPLVGLDPSGVYAERFPHQLSGGECQRGALACALASGCRLLVADEPAGSLDRSTAHAVFRLLRRLAEERGLGVLLITHDMESVLRYCDRAFVLDSGRAGETARPRDALRTMGWME